MSRNKRSQRDNRGMRHEGRLTEPQVERRNQRA